MRRFARRHLLLAAICGILFALLALWWPREPPNTSPSTASPDPAGAASSPWHAKKSQGTPPPSRKIVWPDGEEPEWLGKSQLTREERETTLDALCQLPLDDLLKLLVHSEGHPKAFVRLLPSALTQVLGEALSDEEWQSIERLLIDQSVPVGARLALIDALEESANPKALNVLLKASMHPQSAEPREAIHVAIPNVSALLSSNAPTFDVPGRLATAWEDLTRVNHRDAGTYNALVQGLAADSSAEGVTFLLELLPQIEQASQNPDESAFAEALSEGLWASTRLVRGKEAVASLSSELVRDEENSARFQWAGEALSQAGNLEGTEALVAWARSGKNWDPARFRTWFLRIRDSRSVEYAVSLVDAREHLTLPEEALGVLADFARENR